MLFCLSVVLNVFSIAFRCLKARKHTREKISRSRDARARSTRTFVSSWFNILNLSKWNLSKFVVIKHFG